MAKAMNERASVPIRRKFGSVAGALAPRKVTVGTELSCRRRSVGRRRRVRRRVAGRRHGSTIEVARHEEPEACRSNRSRTCHHQSPVWLKLEATYFVCRGRHRGDDDPMVPEAAVKVTVRPIAGQTDISLCFARCGDATVALDHDSADALVHVTTEVGADLAALAEPLIENAVRRVSNQAVVTHLVGVGVAGSLQARPPATMRPRASMASARTSS